MHNSTEFARTLWPTRHCYAIRACKQTHKIYQSSVKRHETGLLFCVLIYRSETLCSYLVWIENGVGYQAYVSSKRQRIWLCVKTCRTGWCLCGILSCLLPFHYTGFCECPGILSGSQKKAEVLRGTNFYNIHWTILFPLLCYRYCLTPTVCSSMKD